MLQYTFLDATSPISCPGRPTNKALHKDYQHCRAINPAFPDYCNEKSIIKPLNIDI